MYFYLFQGMMFLILRNSNWFLEDLVKMIKIDEMSIQLTKQNS